MPIGSSLGITLPTQGGNTGTWGTDLNTELQKVIDAVEAQVPASAIDFSADFDLNNNSLTSVEGVAFDAQSSYTQLRSLYFDTSGNLYVRDGSNNNIQITASGALNNASAGGLGDSGGTYGTSGITFDWDGTRYNAKDGSGANDYANVRMDELQIRDGSGNDLTIAVPAMSSNYTLTLPSAVPASTGIFLQANTSGTCSWSNSTAQDITLTGSAELKHGQRELVIGASAGQIQDVATGNNTYNAVNDEVTIGTNSHRVCYPINLPVGARILNITYKYFGGDSGAKNCTLFSKNDTDGAAATSESTIAPTSTGNVASIDSGINYTLVTGTRVFATFQASSTSTTDRTAGIVVDWDWP